MLAANDEPTLDLQEKPPASDLNELYAVLTDYVIAQIGFVDSSHFTIFLRASDGIIRGGVSGHAAWGGITIGPLAVKAEYRNRGYGARLLDAAEAEGIARGCTYALLDTMGFTDNVAFYEKRGYAIFGRLKDSRTGFEKCFLTKRLIAD